MANYTPKPVNTSDVLLSEDILNLAEQLAENTHEVWAQARMSEGWVWGARRDDALKTHPCLVAYSDLSEQEKQYDRATSSETLKLILKLGYELVRK